MFKYRLKVFQKLVPIVSHFVFVSPLLLSLAVVRWSREVAEVLERHFGFGTIRVRGQ